MLSCQVEANSQGVVFGCIYVIIVTFQGNFPYLSQCLEEEIEAGLKVVEPLGVEFAVYW